MCHSKDDAKQPQLSEVPIGSKFYIPEPEIVPNFDGVSEYTGPSISSNERFPVKTGFYIHCSFGRYIVISPLLKVCVL